MKSPKKDKSPESKKEKPKGAPEVNKKTLIQNIKDSEFFVPKNVNQYRHIIECYYSRESDLEWMLKLRRHKKIKNIQIKQGFQMNRFDCNFIDYLSEKYFDCFDELASKASGIVNYRRKNSLFNNFRKSTRKIDDNYSSLSYGELDMNNRFYIDKFIIIEKKATFNIVKKHISEEEDEELKKRKRFIRKQSTYKFNIRQNRTIHHQLTIKKVNDFRVLSDEEQFNRNKSKIILNPKFLSIFILVVLPF